NAVSVSENTASMATFMAIEHNSPRRVDVRITLARLLLLFFFIPPLGEMLHYNEPRHLCHGSSAMNKPDLHLTGVLGALPVELTGALFAKPRPLTLKADQALFMAGDEGNGCYRIDEGLLKASVSGPNGNARTRALLR